jgi:hypothetical protein
MSVTSTNPDYDAHLPEWQMMDDSLSGEPAVKANTRYLPKPSGMVEAEKQDTANKYLYDNYRDRAQYEHWVRDSLRSMMGMVSRLQPEITLPAGMEGLRENATSDGFGLKQLFFRMVRQAVSHGRIPLVANMDDAGQPYFSTYKAVNAPNWKTEGIGGRQDLVLAVFIEFRDKDPDDEYSHETVQVYRVFKLIEGVCHSGVLDEDDAVVEEFRPLGTKDSGGAMLKGLDYLPIIYCGSTDNGPDVDEVPLLTMARAAIKSYQISADYFQHLHDNSHDQKYVIGLDQDRELSVTGPGSAWSLPPGCEVGSLRTDPDGIEAKRIAMQDQKGAALEAGAKVMDVPGTESGEARKARQDDQHATLHSIVITVAEAIEQALRYAADWGNHKGDVTFSVQPDFAHPDVNPQVLRELKEAVMSGGVSWDTYWAYLTTGKLPDRPYDDERELVGQQGPQLGLIGNDDGE